MGEYAEMMLDGTCCQNCGEFMGDETGYPRRCESCQLQIKHLKKKRSKLTMTEITELAKTHNAINELEAGAGKKFSNFEEMVEDVNEGVSDE